MTPEKAAELKGKYIFPSVKTYYKEPLLLVEGHGCRVVDGHGTTYLDLFGGILTTSVGHSHPKVVQAITEQVRRLMHTSTCYLSEPMLEVAAKLAEITPGNLQKTFFTNSGSEAIETAIMAARAYTGRFEVVGLRHGYHGRTSLAQTLTAHASWRSMTGVPGILHSHNGYCYRCPFHQTYPGCDVACAANLEEAIRTTTTGEIAAFIAEPVQGVGGFITPPPEFFKIAYEIARKHGAVCIDDEVQSGFGRTGGKMFGIEHWGVEPDMMVFAKGLANGAAIGGTIAKPEIADSIRFSTISTFGGNPVSMAAARATLEVITGENLPAHVAKMGELFFAGLGRLQDLHPCVGERRGKGLMIGLEIVEAGKTGAGKTPAPAPELAVKLMEAAKDEGILVGRGGLYGNVLRVTPPMTISADEVAEALERLGRAFKKAAA